jgi:DNA polymerase epsilon subunit 1
MIKDKGLCVKFIISKKPIEAKVAERAIPTAIFEVEENVKRKFLKKWLKDNNL